MRKFLLALAMIAVVCVPAQAQRLDWTRVDRLDDAQDGYAKTKVVKWGYDCLTASETSYNFEADTGYKFSAFTIFPTTQSAVCCSLRVWWSDTDSTLLGGAVNSDRKFPVNFNTGSASPITFWIECTKVEFTAVASSEALHVVGYEKKL
jgi:hypothetical protein